MMRLLRDLYNRSVRLTEERQAHVQIAHPEMTDSVSRLAETLAEPDMIVRSIQDDAVELFYKHYPSTPVTSKFLCIVIKERPDDCFVVTAYYTDTIKRGERLWDKP